jgi:hypothetical protein
MIAKTKNEGQRTDYYYVTLALLCSHGLEKV